MKNNIILGFSIFLLLIGCKETISTRSAVISSPSAKPTGSISSKTGAEGSTQSAGSTVTVLPAPTAVTTTAEVDDVDINWSSVTGAASYNIYWATSPGVTTSSSLITNATPVYHHTGLNGGVVYYYRVAGVVSGTVGTLSSEVNATPLIGTVADPSFSLAAGSYSRVQLVAISTATAGATIRYSLDGSSPSTTNGTIYSAPFLVPSSLTLKAIAYETNYANSNPVQGVYTFPPSGSVALIAGDGTNGYNGDGILATSAKMNFPQGLAVDSSGAVYIADWTNASIRMAPAISGTWFGQSMTANYIYTIAGGGAGGDGVPATSAQIGSPGAVAVDSSHNLYIADTGCQVIRMVPAVSGTYFGQSMTANYIYVIAGSGGPGLGDGGPATSAWVYKPFGVAVDNAGNVYIEDSVHDRIRMVPATGGNYFGQSMTANYIYTVAGGGSGGLGDGGPATLATISECWGGSESGGVALDSSGNLYISDTLNNLIRMVPVNNGTYFGQSMTANYIYTIAGNGTSGYSGDGIAATSGQISEPQGIGVDSYGNLYIGDQNAGRVRMVPAIGGIYFGQTMTANYIYTIVTAGEIGAAAVDIWGNAYWLGESNGTVGEIFK